MCVPLSVNVIPDPATSSLTVWDTRTSPGWAAAMMRWPVNIAMPPMAWSRYSTSPACTPPSPPPRVPAPRRGLRIRSGWRRPLRPVERSGIAPLHFSQLLGGTSSSDMETPRPWRESSRTLRDVPDDASGGALAPRSKEEHNGDDDEQRHEDG